MSSKALLSISAARIWGIILVMILFASPHLNREINVYDEGVYVVTAKGLASGLGYVRASLPELPPQGLYPPFLPLSLSVVWRVFPNFPDNLLIMRILMLAAGALFLVVCFRYLKEELGFGETAALSIVAMVGLHPFFLELATLLTSEIPYALLSMASMYFYARFISANKARHLGFAIGFAALAALTRAIGVALFGALVVHLLLAHRFRPALIAAACGATIFLPWQIWSWIAQRAYDGYPVEIAMNYRGYIAHLVRADWIAQIGHLLPINLVLCMGAWTSFIFPGGWSNTIWMLGIVVLGIYFYARNLRQQLRLHDLYCAFSFLLILPWPFFQISRYLFVLSPFLIAYFFIGIRFFITGIPTKFWSAQTARQICCIVSILIVSTALVRDCIDFRNYLETRQQVAPIYMEFHKMLDWIRENTPPNAILVGDYDPAYYLFTGRKAIHISFPDPFSIYYTQEVTREFPQAERLLGWFRQVKGCYLIQDSMIGGPEHFYFHNLIQAFRNVSSSAFSPVYIGGNGSFVVYKIGACPEESD